MESWVRDTDSRWYYAELTRDLYGPAIVCWYGGPHHATIRIVPVADTVAGEIELERIAHRRELHGYRRQIASHQ